MIAQTSRYLDISCHLPRELKSAKQKKTQTENEATQRVVMAKHGKNGHD